MLDAVELMPDGDPVEKASVMFDKMDDDGSGDLTEDEFIKVLNMTYLVRLGP